MTVVADAFTRADNADLGASWTAMTGKLNLKIVSNAVQAGTLLADDNTERYSATAFGNDQYARITISTFTKTINNIYAWVSLRCASGADTQYEMIASTDSSNISYINQTIAASKTTVAFVTSGSWTAGDILDGVVRGSTLALYRNGALVVSGTDSGIASGANVGMGIYCPDVLGNIIIDNFQGGDSARMPLYLSRARRMAA